ncbi:hypothetical protein J7L18_02830 [Candidatus Bathyarchaeota archaeon]|nr:hypothetical protein [Candidatus Bathyarchaeota archaeon]
MDNRKIAIIKIFLISLSLITCGEISCALKAESDFPVDPLGPNLWLHLSILLTYAILPVIFILIDNHLLYALLTGVFALRSIIEFVWRLTSFQAFIALLYILAAFLSIILAAEKLSEKVRGEILSLKWSQF